MGGSLSVLSGLRATRCAVPKNTQTLVVPCDGSPTGGNRLAAGRPDFEDALTESIHRAEGIGVRGAATTQSCLRPARVAASAKEALQGRGPWTCWDLQAKRQMQKSRARRNQTLTVHEGTTQATNDLFKTPNKVDKLAKRPRSRTSCCWPPAV